ncbi:ATP-binding cassette domain-containing protein [Ruminococcus flavefaciens]|jgi:ABC-2 type transport system ATP-binding protein|uniref:ABC-2 type transport system ATP-binding protein n=1 Tax=Ruminococcus flavefaciens TaxID=1265 RepID=A0A315XWD5_RUMFL|nr:ATP-binding cassette domain-containing protein [Ruminococcus flavefaciens]PWJ11524.1 ABC-2 type transport system ATP-binding protein [Ruminococcus flavefaciens]SSA50433.1 ABC-2 type transport system ATP-binding protein [Ruminococcus flavefaciens]
MEYILQTQKLCKKYGKFKALNDLTINVPKGSIYGMVGRNGAGKTTLIRVITGLNNPTSGEFSLFGVKNNDGKLLETRRKMGAVVETPSLHPEMSAKDNLIQQTKALGISDEKLDDILKLVGLANTGKKKAKNFSLGMRQRLGIAFSLVGDPEFLVLDEPINGLDPQGIIEVREMIMRLNQEKGITILISSHILDELSRLATHYGFIEHGHVIKEMSAEELDKACRTSLHVNVNDTNILAEVLNGMGAEYRLYSPNEADIFTPMQVTPLVLALNEKNCFVNTMSERHESLESYFMGLVGGVHNG